MVELEVEIDAETFRMRSFKLIRTLSKKKRTKLWPLLARQMVDLYDTMFESGNFASNTPQYRAWKAEAGWSTKPMVRTGRLASHMSRPSTAIIDMRETALKMGASNLFTRTGGRRQRFEMTGTLPFWVDDPEHVDTSYSRAPFNYPAMHNKVGGFSVPTPYGEPGFRQQHVGARPWLVPKGTKQAMEISSESFINRAVRESGFERGE